MRILGIDFTSAPSDRKRITCVHTELQGDVLCVTDSKTWASFSGFEAQLALPGPWIAALDFPFGQSAKFIKNIGWPEVWTDYIGHVSSLSKEQFCDALNEYKRDRAKGDKEHRRATDVVARSISPQKLFGVPVAKMFFEGAPRLLKSGVTIPGLLVGDPNRVVVEGYPGALARHLIGKRSYKNDNPKKQTEDHIAARMDILNGLRGGKLIETHGVHVAADDDITHDPGADDLDALLCAVQAAAAWLQRDDGYGAPEDLNPIEGWIAEPTIWTE